MRDSAIEIINNKFNVFFSPRQLSHEILAKKYGIKLKRIFYNMSDFKAEHHSVIRQLNRILKELAEQGIITKYNRNFWKKKGGNEE